jgi:hypothetical protein
LTAIGAEQLAAHITNLQTKLRIEPTEQGRIALVGCETDKPTSSGTVAEITSLAQVVASRCRLFWQYNCCLGVFWLGHLWHF